MSESASPLRGRVGLITGGSGGIGRAIALRLSREGLAVAVGYGERREPAEEVVRQITSAGGRAIAFGADLRDAHAPDELVSKVEAAIGPIDVLVANAGIGRRRTLEEVTVDDFDEAIAVNLRAPFLLAQRCVPSMRTRGFGRLLFLSSVAAFTGGIVGPHYAASKAALHGLTHFLASRLADAGVTANAIAPALIAETGMLPGNPAELSARVPVGRLGRPEEVAELAYSVLSNGYLTNQVLSLDGGMYPR